MRAVNLIPGLEWLGDIDIQDIPPDDDFFKEGDRPQEQLSGRLYLVMSNQEGIRELRRLWNIFHLNPESPQFERGHGRWKRLFLQLKQIRIWGPEDRLRETGLQEDWEERVEAGEENVPLELELWFRGTASQRDEAGNTVRRRIVDLEGEVTGGAVIDEIRYHGLTATIPIRNVGELNQLPETQLVGSGEIMFIRPVGQFSVPLYDGEVILGSPVPTTAVPPMEEPIVCLLDGMPLGNHAWLAGRLRIHDPDNWVGDCPPAERFHGTAMASLILHGEGDSPGQALNRPLYVRPILKPDPADWRRPRVESIPENVVPADLLYRSVKRLYEGENGEAPEAPNIRFINLSICDPSRPFFQWPSPLARTLGYLSWRYKVLFVVSAGNCLGRLELDSLIADWSTTSSNQAEIEKQVLRAINNDARNRRILAPAESINAITVGSTHEDSSSPSLPRVFVDPFANGTCVSPLSAQGTGFSRSVKPDLLLPGGRQIYRDNVLGRNGKIVLERQDSPAIAPGQRVASPSVQASVLDGTAYVRGTSNATALTTRLAALLYDTIEEIREEPNGDLIREECLPIIIKALLVHGSSWGVLGAKVRQLLPMADQDTLARLLGYGAVEPARLFECTVERATIIGSGVLIDQQAHRYELPLPQSLSGENVRRRMTVTLAWLSPTNSAHKGYRQAQLWFEPYGEDNQDSNAMVTLRIPRQEVDWRTVRRGTVQHEIFEGNRATTFGVNDQIRIQVNCRAGAGTLDVPIDYALIVTLEVAEGVGIPIYEEIRARIQQPVPIRVGA